MAISAFQAQFSASLPAADLAQRFGYYNAFGIGFHRKTAGNIWFGAETNLIFGEIVKENPLMRIETSLGYLINANGQLQELRYQMRGFNALADVGYIIPCNAKNPNSGVTPKFSVGYTSHRIKYYAPGGAPPQIDGEYVKGYDRLTGGITLGQSIGYTHFNKRNFLNFSVDAGVLECFGRSQRTYDFLLMKEDDSKRLDLTIFLKGSILLPLYGKQGPSEYFY